MALLKVEPEEMSLNMTPIIDIVFNLLIFFLLGSTYLNDERELELDLPRVPAAAPLTAAPDELTIHVRADGTITIDEKPQTISALEELLAKARANYPDQAVAIRGDRRVPYEVILSIVSVCRRAGIERVDFLAMEQPP